MTLNVSKLFFELSVYLGFSEMLNSDEYKLEAIDIIGSWCLKLLWIKFLFCLSLYLLVSDWYFFCFIMNTKPVISLCLSVLFVMGECTNSLRKSPSHHIVFMCGHIVTFLIFSVQVVSQHFQVAHWLCHEHRMNMAMSNFLFAKKRKPKMYYVMFYW